MTRLTFLLFTTATLLFSQPVQVTIPDTEADSGAICLIPIMLDTVTGSEIIGIDITLSFRGEIISAESVWAGNVAPSGWITMFNRSNPGELLIAMAGAEPLIGAGALCTLKFIVTGRPGDTTTNHFSRCLLNEGNVPCSTRDGIFSVIGPGISESIIENASFSIENYPNPFSHTTEIRYGLPINTRLKIGVYNSFGQEIATLVNGIQNLGWYSVKWNGKDDKGKICPNGIYFYRLESEEFKATKKMVKMK
jgi:hypothetical protein